jgi:hypothetical protein
VNIINNNVYMAAFLTGWVWVKLYEDTVLPPGEKAIYMDTDSVIYVATDDAG